MSALLRVDNFAPSNVREIAQLKEDAAAAANTATLVSVQQVAATDILYIDRLGTESVEKQVVQSIAGLIITIVGTFVRQHSAGARVTFLRGNQHKIYRAANVDGTIPADADFSLLAGGTVDIDYDQAHTDFQDSTGGSDYWYKATQYNTVSSTETSLAEAKAVRGGGFGHYCGIDAIRGEAGFTQNPYITDAMIATRRDDAESEINGELVGMYTIPFTAPIAPIITNITRLLAAGWLLAAEYGPVSSGTNKDAKDKLDQARAMLARIKKREITLTGVTGEAETISDGISGWPNNSTPTTPMAQGGSTRKFRMEQEF